MDVTNAATRAILRRMRKAVQQDLFEGKRENGPRRYKHGGELNVGKRKISRPFQRNKALHIVFKSSQAKGKNSMLAPQNKIAIDKIIEKQARKQQAKIHAQQNVGNHFHLMVSFRTKDQLKQFMRAVSGLIARHVVKSRKGKPAKSKFWDHIPFTRIVQGINDFYGMLRYVMKNTLEAEIGKEFREGVERFDRAQAKAKKTGKDIRECL